MRPLPLRVSCAAALLLAVCCGTAHASRRLLVEEGSPAQDGCSLPALDKRIPEVSTILQVIAAFNLLPDGVPLDSTVFLPNDKATAQLPAALDLPFTTETLIDAADALGPQLKQRLLSLLAYHILPEGALDALELSEVRDVATALNGTALLATQAPTGGMVLTDSIGRQAHVMGGPSRGILEDCSAAIYVLDQFLMPAESLKELPRTTLAEAQGMLGMPGTMPPPVPAP